MKLDRYLTGILTFLAGLSLSLGLTRAESRFSEGFVFGLGACCCLLILLAILLIVILVVVLLIKKMLI